MVDVKDVNRDKLQALLDEEVSGPLGDQIMNLVDDIVTDEREDADNECRRDLGFA